MARKLTWSPQIVAPPFLLCSTSFEVLKTHAAANRNDNLRDAIRKTWARGGVAGFYQGLIPWVSFISVSLGRHIHFSLGPVTRPSRVRDCVSLHCRNQVNRIDRRTTLLTCKLVLRSYWTAGLDRKRWGRCRASVHCERSRGSISSSRYQLSVGWLTRWFGRWCRSGELRERVRHSCSVSWLTWTSSSCEAYAVMGVCTTMKTAEVTRQKATLQAVIPGQAPINVPTLGPWGFFMDTFKREGIRGVNKGVNAVAVGRAGLGPLRARTPLN